MKFFIAAAMILIGFSLQAETTKKYLVKGMHCGGCEGGVRASLIELGGLKDEQVVKVDSSSPNPKEQIGHVIVKFSDKEYQGKATDCKLAKAIKKNPGYELYWDAADTNPCSL